LPLLCPSGRSYVALDVEDGAIFPRSDGRFNSIDPSNGASEPIGTGTLYIEPGSPWENGYCDSLNGKLRNECLNGEIFYSLKEAQVVIERWRVEYNTRRPHSALVPPNQSSQLMAVM
jgi:hypothetical protein